jgi:hypothetical protein
MMPGPTPATSCQWAFRYAIRRSPTSVLPLGVMDDPYDLTEFAWRHRVARRLAEERGLAWAGHRAAALRAAAECAEPLIKFAKRPPSPALLAHLAAVRPRGHPARWQGGGCRDPARVHGLGRAAPLVPNHRRAAPRRRARAEPGALKHPDPAKVAPGGGVYR